MKHASVLSTAFVCHDASITLIADGRVWAIELERFSRVRNNMDKRAATRFFLDEDYDALNALVSERVDPALVQRAVDALLASAGLAFEDVDIHLDLYGEHTRHRGRRPDPVLSHHTQHCASAYYASGFDEAAVLSLDSSGDCVGRDGDLDLFETITLMRGRGRALEPVARILTTEAFDAGRYCSLGFFYGTMTTFCGFLTEEDGKLMGLSAYGSDRYVAPLRRFVTRDDRGTWWFDEAIRGYVLGELAAQGHSFEARADFAFATQTIFEEVVLTYVQWAHELTGSANLCLGGGSFLNTVFNGKIRDLTPFERVFIVPPANDAGLSLGNALGYFYRMPEHAAVDLDLNHFQLGPRYTDAEVEAAVAARAGLRVHRLGGFDAVAAETARRLASGQIVGWFQGRSEMGPRALGNRSIFCDPRRAENKDVLNAKVKFREWFRPFAAMVRHDRAHAYFDLDHASPYMLLVRDVISDAIPAVTHVDGTARIQTLSPEQNPRAHALLTRFEAETGLPVLLNTSLNTRGQPLAETPDDALDTLLGSELDALVLHDLLVERAAPGD